MVPLFPQGYPHLLVLQLCMYNTQAVYLCSIIHKLDGTQAILRRPPGQLRRNGSVGQHVFMENLLGTKHRGTECRQHGPCLPGPDVKAVRQ